MKYSASELIYLIKGQSSDAQFNIEDCVLNLKLKVWCLTCYWKLSAQILHWGLSTKKVDEGIITGSLLVLMLNLLLRLAVEKYQIDHRLVLLLKIRAYVMLGDFASIGFLDGIEARWLNLLSRLRSLTYCQDLTTQYLMIFLRNLTCLLRFYA